MFALQGTKQGGEEKILDLEKQMGNVPLMLLHSDPCLLFVPSAVVTLAFWIELDTPGNFTVFLFSVSSFWNTFSVNTYFAHFLTYFKLRLHLLSTIYLKSLFKITNYLPQHSNPLNRLLLFSFPPFFPLY